MLPTQNTLELLQKVESKNLYQNLIKQINKDFQLSNLNNCFEQTLTPLQLKESLSKVVQLMMTTTYDDYLNFMYRVDVPEKELLEIKSDNLEKVIAQITFLILKREYQKIWFKSKL
jgi:hypothetical protein